MHDIFTAKIVATAFVISLTFSGFSQGFDGGLFAGIAPTQVDGDNYWGFNKAGIIAGGFVTHSFKNDVGAKMALRFIEKGSQKGKNDGEDMPYYKARLQYVEMPVTATFMYKKKLELEGGLAFGYLISAKEAKNDYYLDNANPEFNSFEVSGLVGLSYHINKTWAITAQFMYSLNSIRGASNLNKYAPSGQYNQVTSLYLTYKLSPK